MVVNVSTKLHCFKDLYIAVCSGQSTSQDCQTSFVAFKGLCVAVHSGSFHSCVVSNCIFFTFFPTHCCQVRMAWLWGPLGRCHSCKCITCDVAKIFFTSKFSFILFYNPTYKTKTGTAYRWETTNSKPPGPIRVFGQSQTGSSSLLHNSE
jgi:hypothetical protein